MILLMLILLGVMIACGVGYMNGRDTTSAIGTAEHIAASPLETDDVAPDCSESSGLLRAAVVADGDARTRWSCVNFTGYTDSRGHKVGGNCDGPVSYSGRVDCECMPAVDPVTKTTRPTTRVEIQGLHLCVPNADLFEAD